MIATKITFDAHVNNISKDICFALDAMFVNVNYLGRLKETFMDQNKIILSKRCEGKNQVTQSPNIWLAMIAKVAIVNRVLGLDTQTYSDWTMPTNSINLYSGCYQLKIETDIFSSAPAYDAPQHVDDHFESELRESSGIFLSKIPEKYLKNIKKQGQKLFLSNALAVQSQGL